MPSAPAVAVCLLDGSTPGPAAFLGSFKTLPLGLQGGASSCKPHVLTAEQWRAGLCPPPAMVPLALIGSS